jgi:hypothetical protein
MSKYRRKESSSEDSDSEEERRKKDIKERDEFASRLKVKDESKTRKLALPAGSGAGKNHFSILIFISCDYKLVMVFKPLSDVI